MPLIAPPPVRDFEPSEVPKNWKRWASDEEVRGDYNFGLVDRFLYNAALDSKSECHPSLGPILSVRIFGIHVPPGPQRRGPGDSRAPEAPSGSNRPLAQPENASASPLSGGGNMLCVNSEGDFTFRAFLRRDYYRPQVNQRKGGSWNTCYTACG